MRLLLLRNFPKPVRLLILGELLLLVLFGIGFWVLWQRLPADGVKLHANIDTGVDLLGTRAEFGWLAGIVAALIAGNTLLAAWLRSSQPAAAAMLLGATIPLLVGFLGVLLFIARLNLQLP
ncbi:MAG: hypothetical protein Q8R32_00615 [bacterium]|nr:hypothetical protein [bacterium]